MSKLTQEEAEKLLNDAGITWSSSGSCSDRNNSHCTSFEQINSRTVEGIIALKKASRIAINITGGTELGHSSGSQSHWHGYKLDITPSKEISQYITETFEYVGVRGDGAKMYKSKSGDIYARESNHWDITFV
ncbi:MAG TPA: hypothetical protein VGJ05_19750 [Fimbriiglobus sp.]|jgi:hypothetical protein